MKKTKIKKNDEVLVIRGKDKGARGKVLKVFPATGTAIVERINMMKRHTRPNPQKNVQGGVLDMEAAPAGIAHETTASTGLRHVDGTLSIARGQPGTGSAAAFFIVLGDQPSLDFGGMRNPDAQGFAAFGKVIDGMEVVREINAIDADAPTEDDYVRGQILAEPIRFRAKRVKR